MTTIDKIRAEIKRLKKEVCDNRPYFKNTLYCLGYDDAFFDLLCFLDTLEEMEEMEAMKPEKDLDRIIHEAFQEHFHFPIEEADTEGLNHISTEDTPIESYAYMGQTFLYIETFSEIEHDQDKVKLDFGFKYRKI